MARGRILVLSGVGAALLLFGGLFTWIVSADSYGPDRQLDLAMRLLDDGRWDLADRMARDIEVADQLNSAREPVWNYVRGVAGALSTVDHLDSPRHRKLLWESAEFLEKCREAGWPIGYAGRGAYYLGYCYFNTYDWEKALDALSQAVNDWPERRSDALEKMVEACLRSQPPKRETAEDLIDRWRSIPGLAQREKDRIVLNQAHLAFLDGQWETCEELLSSLGEESEEYFSAKLGRGRWKLESARQLTKNEKERKSRLEQARADFREVMLAPATPAEVRRQSTFLTGQTLHLLGKTTEALSTLSGVRQRNPQSAESIASGIEEAEIQLLHGHMSDALETARHVVIDLGDVRLYDERWLPLKELRRRFLQMGREMREQGEHESSIRLASYLPPVFPVSDSVRLEAETFESWGAQLEAEPLAGTARERDQQRRRVDAKYSMAGDKYRELARLELRSSEYPSILWQAIDCYRKSSQLDQANELLKTYLQFEERPKRPRGLLALGQNYLNAGRWDEVIQPLERCLLEYPDHPTAYSVRLVMARALTEKQELDGATEALMKNLYDGNLRPDSQLWRDSLFELGNVIYRRGDQLLLEGTLTSADDWTKRLEKLKSSHDDFLAATSRLSEAVSRFEKDARSLEARYALGRAYRSAATFPKQMLDSGQVTIDAVRRKLLLERRQLLESSLASYRDLRAALGTAQDSSKANEGGQALLRNCFFGEADVLYDLEQYEEAIAAYRNVGNRFMNEPEALEALVQIAECFRALGQEDQARRSLNQAEQMLSRIPPESDARFTAVTRADRAKWQQLLTWLKK